MYYNLSLRYKRTCLENKPAIFWQSVGEKKALNLFHQAARRVPAYLKFLCEHNVRPGSVRTMDDFSKVPITSKENYINQYPFAELCWDGKVDNGLTIAQSSGTSNIPFLWARSPANEAKAAIIQQLLFEKFLDVHSAPALFVVCFHLGSHIAGMITVDAIKRMFEHGLPGALVTPGLNQEDILGMIIKLWPNYKRIVLVGYPPFIKDIIDIGKQRGIVWQDKLVSLIVSGEAVAEPWRDLVAAALVQPISRIINLYGSADVGLMGFETTDTINIRRFSQTDETVRLLFGSDSDFTPPIYQFDPSSRYFEELNGELICTADIGLPLIRYNIHDRGRIVLPDKISSLMFNTRKSKFSWQLPFISVLGRSNYATTFYALNIYPEHIREILSKPEISTKVSGRFFLKTVYDQNQNQFLEIHIEACANIENDKIWEDIRQIMIQGLCSLSGEYKKLYMALGNKAEPVIKAYPAGSEVFRAIKMKYKYIVNEK